MKKTIIVDCDGVVLNWEYAFDIFMQEHGFTKVEGCKCVCMISAQRYGIDLVQGRKLIKIFNESASIGFLPPLRDAVEYVTRMADEGWRFIAITSLSTNRFAQKLRKRNLEKLFGKDTFIEVTCLATGADKDDALAKYAGSGMYWVEDKPVNALAGAKVGLKPILMEHGFNMNNKDFPLAKNWKEIYEIVSG
jgi:hypothetical protein